jgi:replicative DNA helicase
VDASDHGRVVLSAVLAGGGSIKALDYALARVTTDHFVDPVQATLFELCQRYADQTKGVLRRETLADLLRNAEPGKALMYGEYYDALARTQPALDQFLHSVAMLRELAAERATGETLAQGMEILRNGVRDARGNELRGHQDARAHVLGGLAEVERDAGLTESPEGDARHEADEALAAYARAKEKRLKGEAPGILFGIDELDDKLPGGQAPGEILIVAGWTSAGKTAWCVQQAWHAAVMQGKNVVYLTTETLRPQIRTRLISRHSRMDKFGLAQGINDRDIRAGWLDERGERAFQAVLDDFSTCPDYGRCYVVQVPRRGTISSAEARLNAISRQFRPDLVIIDYLGLLYPDRPKRESGVREDLSGILKDAKQVATTANGGDGVPVISPWQVNREGRKLVKEAGGYALENMAETQEVANTADMVLALVDPPKDTSRGRAVPIEASMLKNRGGERNFTVQLTADFATSYFSCRNRIAGEDGLLDG